ncbi:N-acetylmuramoyl-L-alanine amidase [Streptomyces sp. NPDC006654]|uniref:N-acetylmuramoyl-L-alanine amidase n=1 Tax=unclassified Streptomyces TaxID=2593676 RepID=UPI0033FAB300
MDRARPLPSRRRLLTGAALAVVPYTLLPETRADARTAVVDYPRAEWAAASSVNRTPAQRPDEHRIDRVIVHVAQQSYAGTLATFQNPKQRVSAHYLVRSADGHVAQCVRETDIAWHAGNWDYNTRSIGIEHEGWVDRPEYFTDLLYAESARLTASICERYGIPKDREHVIGHVEVPGTDHTDPGVHWDWSRYMKLIGLASLDSPD